MIPLRKIHLHHHFLWGPFHLPQLMNYCHLISSRSPFHLHRQFSIRLTVHYFHPLHLRNFFQQPLNARRLHQWNTNRLFSRTHPTLKVSRSTLTTHPKQTHLFSFTPPPQQFLQNTLINKFILHFVIESCSYTTCVQS